jgi:hypothetical protein
MDWPEVAITHASGINGFSAANARNEAMNTNRNVRTGYGLRGKALQIFIAGLVALVMQVGQVFGVEVSGQNTRGWVGVGEGVLIVGFELTGTGTSQVLLYGVGPSLAYAGVTGVLDDPKIRLVDTVTGIPVSSNDDWRDHPSATLTEQYLNERGLSIGDDEAAMVLVLGAGYYSLVVEGADGGTGIALAGVQRVYLSTDDGSTDDGSTDDGSTDDGSTDDGSTDDGSTDDGSTDDGSTDDGSTDDGSTDDGSVVDRIASGAWTGGDPVTEDPYFVCFNVSEDGTLLTASRSTCSGDDPNRNSFDIQYEGGISPLGERCSSSASFSEDIAIQSDGSFRKTFLNDFTDITVTGQFAGDDTASGMVRVKGIHGDCSVNWVATSP